MKAKSFGLSPMSRRRFLGILGTMVGACVFSGALMRRSLTDVNAGRPSLDDIDFRVSPGTEGVVGLYTRQDVLADLEKEGLGPDDFDFSEAQSKYYMAVDNVEEIASVIVVGRFTGRRQYVFHALRERVAVTRVLKGEGLATGELIDVLEAYTIKEDGVTSTGDNGQFSTDRIITEGEGGYGAGNAPMREGQEYLLFLEPKRYPAEWGDQVPAKTYCLALHPYARIATDIDESKSADRIKVVPIDGLETQRVGQATVVRMPRIPLREAVKKDVYVQTDRAKVMHLLTARGILERVCGHTADETSSRAPAFPSG